MQIPANRERSKPSRDREGADAAHALKIRETVNPGILSKLMNRLYYGDNLTVLRGCIDNESVDLVYLDPPFNSQATYNVLFRVASGERSRARIEAFDDTWHWGDEAELAFDGVMTGQNSEAAEMLRSMRAFLKENDMMAYLSMMAVRLLELHRVLKPPGSLYLHCDPTASHYLKILMDAFFGAKNFRNEITWKRRGGMSSAVHESNRFGACTDIILFYAKTDHVLFSPQYNKDTPEYREYIRTRFTMVDEKGRRFQPDNLTNPAFRRNLIYEYKGYQPPANGWAISKQKMASEAKTSPDGHAMWEQRINVPSIPGGVGYRSSWTWVP